MPTLNEFRAKIQFVAQARMPNLIYRACQKTGTVSNTRYIQEAVTQRLARDLGLDYDTLINELPPCKGAASFLDNRHSQPKRVPAQGN